MADQVQVCGKLYQPQTTVVTVREEPQWIAGTEQDCSGSSLLSPLPKPSGASQVGLSNALQVAAARLRGMPQFMPAASTSVNGATGSVMSAGVTAVFPVVPPLSMSVLGPSGSVPKGNQGSLNMVCAAGESQLQTDVSFPCGRQEVPLAERDKLRRLQGRTISSVVIDGLTETPGLASSMVPLARARAQSVQQAIQDVVPPGVSVQQRIRAGCCMKTGEPGSAGHEDIGVSVTVCLGVLLPVKKGDGNSMAK